MLNFLLLMFNNFNNHLNYNYELHLLLIEQYKQHLKNTIRMEEQTRNEENNKIEMYETTFINKISVF